MQQTQFFLFGLLVVWLTGTGKLAAFVKALRDPAPAGSAGDSSSGAHVDPSTGKIVVPDPNNPNGPPLTVYG